VKRKLLGVFDLFGDIIVGVDIGATKVCTVIARTKRQNQIEVLGYGISKCSGIKKGLIVDLENVSRAIKESVSMAEKAANVKVTAITIAISGFHTVLIPSKGKIILAGNHTNNFDSVLLLATTKRQIHFLAKDELTKGIKKIFLPII